MGIIYYLSLLDKEDITHQAQHLNSKGVFN